MGKWHVILLQVYIVIVNYYHTEIYLFLGPFCGNKVADIGKLEIGSSQMLVVFYSDQRGGRRKEGVFQGIITVAGKLL